MMNGKGNRSGKRSMSKGEVLFSDLGWSDARKGKVFSIPRHFTNKYYALGYMEELMRQKRQRRK